MNEGSNIATMHEAISDAVDTVVSLKADRAVINEEINRVKANLVSMGITRRAFNRALADFEQQKSEDGERKNKAEADAYAICRAALGMPPIDPDAIPEAPEPEAASEPEPEHEDETDDFDEDEGEEEVIEYEDDEPDDDIGEGTDASEADAAAQSLQ